MAGEHRFPLRQRLLYWLAVNIGGRVLRLMFSTCRVEMLSPEEKKHYFDEGRPAIGVTWHRASIFFLYDFGPKKAAIMISRSRDGEYLARFTQMMGCVPVRGSSQKGGFVALKAMVDFLKSGQGLYAGTVADGPRGPRYKAQKGMILLAMLTGLPLIPILWSSDRVWVFKKAWDRTMIPKPFAKVKIMAGRQFTFPPQMTDQEIEAARLELEAELNRLKDHLDGICGYQDPS